MWLSKTKSGIVRIFLNKPIRWAVNSIEKNIWVDTSGWNNGTSFGFPLNVPAENKKSDWEDHISWEDEPIEIDIVSIKEMLSTQRELHELNNYKTAVIELQKNMKTLDVDISKCVDENFWNLIDC